MEGKRDDTMLMNFLDAYNECFYKKDLEALKEFYDTDSNVLIYLDNHKNNDTYTVEEHLILIADFFEKGKATESGGVEPLIIDNMHVFHKGEAACLCYNARYQSFPVPAVRCTMYVEWINGNWKIVHVHCSFEP